MSKTEKIKTNGVITSIIIPSNCPSRLNSDLEMLDSITYRDYFCVILIDDKETDIFCDFDNEPHSITREDWLKLPVRPESYWKLKRDIDFYQFHEEQMGIDHTRPGYRPCPTVTIIDELQSQEMVKHE